MPILERFACPAAAAPGFVVPLFSRHPGANLFQIQRVDWSGRVQAFEDIAREPSLERSASEAVTIEVGDPAIWAFLVANGDIHVGTKQDLRNRAPGLLSPELIERWPASAADLIDLCELEDTLPDQTQEVYAAMTRQIGVGATIWRDTDLLLPLVRQYFGARLDKRTSPLILSDVWTRTVGETCHVFFPAHLLGRNEPDLSGIANKASAWGVTGFKFHPQKVDSVPRDNPILTWPVTGEGGVGRWTVRRMWNSVGPHLNATVRARIESDALEGRLRVHSATMPGGPVCPELHIVIHGSGRDDVEASHRLFGTKRPGTIWHAVNIRPLGIDPERVQAIPVQTIVDGGPGLDYVWVVTNHRPRRVATHYVGLARSQIASRYARACISALGDLSYTPHGRKLLQDTAGSRAIGLVGATRYLTDMSMQDLLLRVLYSMLSPEWTFGGAKLVCFWPHPLPEGSVEYVRLGGYHYAIEMIGLKQSSARADIRCLAFGASIRPAGTRAYADYIASVMAAWGWELRSGDGEELLFEEQGGFISMFVADTPERLDAILRRNRDVGPQLDIVVTNRSLTKVQKRQAEEGAWPIIHHTEIPGWLRHECGEPGQMPAGGRKFAVE